ncbi:GNAT family N-acetyltransferase [Paenibacillus sp. 1781tsa1]|uniref:GNAT family N-acetyltransferase n=1 Tax=Paenibacillus sp. 1781tsa1 TaxID=2953810 RepID=UPI00209E15C8|nr:GNAT family N-acetyltransferase [Paenibacillus sp. 1781tsa1]MCP1183740.1 GNAT family N-acetyltransferase [Paenibacillus sp. 1781tsa1]
MIHLKRVSVDNWYACTQLEVSEEQKNSFPAPVVYWIAESKVVEDFQPMAIYFDSKLVGFAVYSDRPDHEDNYWLLALMIDTKYQGRGYGREALRKLINLMKESLKCKRIMIGHRPENGIAGNLYESIGFHRVSEGLIDGEVVRLLRCE